MSSSSQTSLLGAARSGFPAVLACVVLLSAPAQGAPPVAGQPGTAPSGPSYSVPQGYRQQYYERYCRYYEQYYRQYYPQYYALYCGYSRPPAPVPAAPGTGYAPPPYAPEQVPEQEQEPEPPFFDLAAGTEFPLGFGGELGLELPARILLRTDLLWMPAFYGSAIVGIIDTFGREGNVIGPAVEESLANSFAFQLSAGWRPFSDFGLEIFGGYTGIVVAGEATPTVASSVVEDEELKIHIEDNLTEPMPVDAHLHNFHIAVGWRFLAADDHLVIRVNAGYTQTLGASCGLEVPEHPDFEDELVTSFTERLDEIVTNDVKLPLFGLSIGYRF